LTTPKKTEPAKAVENKNPFYLAVQKHFNYIDSIRKIHPDLIEAENIKLQQTIISYKADIFNLSDTSNYDLLYIAKSADKKLCLVSWDTRMGGTMIDFTTMAIYQTSSGDTISRMLVDTSENPMGNTLMHYDNLYCVKDTDKAIYIAHGFGRGSTALPWQELRAFQIDGRQLNNPKIFPEQKPNLFIEFNIHKLNRQEVPMILVIDSGKTISSPMPTEDEGFSGKYQQLIFKNGTYKVQ
jgi:hypothetical protein